MHSRVEPCLWSLSIFHKPRRQKPKPEDNHAQALYAGGLSSSSALLQTCSAAIPLLKSRTIFTTQSSAPVLRNGDKKGNTDVASHSRTPKATVRKPNRQPEGILAPQPAAQISWGHHHVPVVTHTINCKRLHGWIRAAVCNTLTYRLTSRVSPVSATNRHFPFSTASC